MWFKDLALGSYNKRTWSIYPKDIEIFHRRKTYLSWDLKFSEEKIELRKDGESS